ncbi:MAG: lysophospholipid acyltransferase family protein [Sandaracinaceae bacterium]
MAMDPTSRSYRAIRKIARAVVRSYYSTIEATGSDRVDARVATLYAPTHPNSILDPLLVGLYEDRPIRFVARDGLFDIPGFGALLRAAGAIPIARRSDHGGEVDNSAAFTACLDALRAGGAIVLFPEGKTHGRLRVEPLRTGLARIALDAKEHGVDVRIVPVGLNYLVRHAFRSDVHVAFGEPIAPEGEVRELTSRIERELRELSVHIEREDDERLIAQLTMLVADIREREGADRAATPAERVALARRVVDAYRWLEERDPERTSILRDRLQALLETRAELGLGGERPALQHRGEAVRHKKWTGDPMLFALAAPLALYGVVNHAPAYLAMRAALALSPPSFAQGALFRLGVGAGALAIAYGVQSALVGGTLGPGLGVLYALSLAPSGLFARRYLAELRVHRLGPRRFFRALASRDRLAWFRAERDALSEELAEIRREYLAQHGELVPA